MKKIQLSFFHIILVFVVFDVIWIVAFGIFLLLTLFYNGIIPITEQSGNLLPQWLQGYLIFLALSSLKLDMLSLCNSLLGGALFIIGLMERDNSKLVKATLCILASLAFVVFSAFDYANVISMGLDLYMKSK